jgi:hypothetical protein
MRNRVSLLLGVMAFCVLPAANAFAYIDAGTGSLIIQLAMGAFLGALLTVRLWWAKLKDLLARIAGRHDKDDANG